MTEKDDIKNPGKGRSPASFSIADDVQEAVESQAHGPRPTPQSFDSNVIMTPDAEDPFIGATEAIPGIEQIPAGKRGFPLAGIAMTALGILFSMAFGLWADRLIRDLFSRSDWLGYIALSTLAIALAALALVILREVAGIMRLGAVQELKSEADKAYQDRKPAAARAVVGKLSTLLSGNPATLKGRKTLQETESDIIDAPQLIELAETELLGPLDRQARALILNASKRVSVVTAVSPRAIVDLAYVLFEVTRLVRAMADLYGGRPGSLGMLRLIKNVFAHLAVTGSIAIGDGLAQQVLGHGLASRLSARLGEGVINGLMTARIGIAAMDLCRPLTFRVAKRPGIGDFIADLTPTLGGKTASKTD